MTVSTPLDPAAPTLPAPPTNLEVLRRQRGQTQRETAHELGLSLSLYASIERGRYRPTARVAGRIEARFGFRIDVLQQPARVVADECVRSRRRPAATASAPNETRAS